MSQATGYRLPAETRLGPVRLQIADLARSLEYYQRVLGLRVVAHEAQGALLAPHGDDRVLIELRERPGARPTVQRGRLGLYHYAILLPDRPSLGRFVRHLAELDERAGAGDHIVSEAFYLRDPDGLGIEVYADRPRDTWQRVHGEIVMATDPVDADAIMRAAGDTRWTGMPAGTVMGHVHLHVGAIPDARAFYADALGLDVTTASYPGALFLSAGGYHHHLGTNIWAGAGALPAGEDDAQLLQWTIELPSAADVAQAADNIRTAGYSVEHDAEGVSLENAGGAAVRVRDPWGTALLLHAAASD